MSISPLTEDEVRGALRAARLESVGPITKMDIGWSSEVYSVGEQYILKAAKSEEDNESLKKEIFLCNLFRNTIPGPQIIYADTEQKTIGRNFFIYTKIEGVNLYTKWHEYSISERKDVVRQICAFLKAVNRVSTDAFASAFGAAPSWGEKFLSMLQSEIQKTLTRGALSPNLATRIEAYASRNASALDNAHMALTYYDPHFDNFLVRGTEVVGMLDLERTDVTSIDYVLYVVKLMVEKPLKYASEGVKQYIKPQDYAPLMEWYKEYYPELFDFPNLETKLNLYLIHHDLEDLYHWPNSDMLKKDLTRRTQS